MMNQTMRVVQHGAGGPPSCLVMGEASIPTPQADEVLIKVAYAGVNRPDCLQRSGSYPPPPGASPFIGLEASGVVQAVGAQVTQWKVGDRVCALTNGGAYAEYVCAAEGQVLPIPEGLSFLQAAALPENYFTVFVNVFMRGNLSAGESILVHGGSSGIGLTAIQLAKAFGATVYCTVGSDDKAQACLKAGADAAINYREQDFVTRIAELTEKQGVNMVLDMVGGEYTDRNLKCLGQLGRLVQIAFLQGSKASIDMSPIMLRRLSFTGSTLRPRTSAEKHAIAVELKNKVWPLLGRGKALPVIHQVFQINEAAEAHALMESSTHIGKIMLAVTPNN
jgi:NADPH:quinone reductase